MATITESVTNFTPSLSGVNEIESQMALQLFPNPATDHNNFLVKSNDFTSILKGEIFNQEGAIIYSNNVITNRYYTFSTSHLTSGFYYLKITSKNKSITTKFIVTM